MAERNYPPMTEEHGHADAGMAGIAARFAAGLGPVGAVAGAAAGMPTAEPAHRRPHHKGVWPIEIPAMVYTVSGGLLVPGQGLAGSAHVGPTPGFFWDLTRITIDGLAGLGVPVSAQGTQAAPAANTQIAIVSAASITPGWYNIAWTVSLAGTPGANDVDNFQLRQGANTIATSSNPGAVGEYPQPTFGPVFLNGTQAIVVRSGSNAATAGSVYAAAISLEPVVGATDVVTLYRTASGIVAPPKRLRSFTAAGITPGPDWEPGKGAGIMRDGDALLLSGSNLAATQVVLSGDAILIEAAWIGEYLS